MKNLFLIFGLFLLPLVASSTRAANANLAEDFYCTVYDNYYTSAGDFIGTIVREATTGEDCGQSNNIVLRKMQ